MNKPQIDKILHKNQLFGAFEPAARNRILAHMRPVALKLGTVVWRLIPLTQVRLYVVWASCWPGLGFSSDCRA
jgi:hypothetical protein